MRLWPFVLLTLAGASWGFGFPMGKIALAELSPPHMVMLRLGVAGVAALPYLIVSPAARRMLRRDPYVWLAAFSYGPAFLVQFEGLRHLTVSLAALLVGLMPALIAVASPLFGERVGRRGWMGVIAATAGAGVIALGAGAAGGSLLGVLISVASLLVWLVYVWAVRRMPPCEDVLAGPAVVVVIGAISAVLFAAPVYGLPPLKLSPGVWGALLVAGLVSSLLATAAWQIASRHAPAASAGVFINLEPVVGAAIGVALFGDPLTWPLVLGGVLILVGSVVVVLSGDAPPPPEPA